MTRKSYAPELIRFVTVVGPKTKPNAAKDKNGSDIYVRDAELMRIIANYFGARYEILTPPDGAYGTRLPDGNWTGMVGMVHREEADLGMSNIAVTAGRFSDVNYIYPHRFTTLSFTTDAPVPMHMNLAIFYPFSRTLWFTIAGLTLAMSFLFYVLLDRNQTFQTVLLKTVRSTLENVLDFKTRKQSVKMVAFSWILGMFLVASSYKAVLLSFLTFPTMVGIKSISDLSKAASTDPSFKCITATGSYVIEYLIRSNDSSWMAIGECLIRSAIPGDQMDNFLAMPRGKAFVGNKMATVAFERRYFVSEENFCIEFYGIPFSKTFCCPERLNRMVHRLLSTGIFEKLYRDENFFRVLKTPSLREGYLKVSNVISLEDLSSSFYILALGWIAGFIVLLIEIAIKKYH